MELHKLDIYTQEAIIQRMVETQTYNKIDNLDTDDKNCLLHTISDFEKEIEEAFNENSPFSMINWFQAYVLSPEFAELNRDKQKANFAQFEHLRFLFKQIDSFMQDHRLGGYNYENDILTRHLKAI